jgi:uncharacterized protein YwgA
MGKGIALEFKRRFPDMYDDYVPRCQAGEVRLGRPYLFRRASIPWILNFPTKDHWRSVARLDSIVAGLRYLKRHYRGWGITSLAVPPLGCGQGQLEWRVVGPTLVRFLRELEIPIDLYAPFGTPSEELQLDFLEHSPDSSGESDGGVPRSRIDPSWVALVEILKRIEQEPYHWPVGRVAFQKIAYFATESGLPTGLNYERGSFGPYARQAKQLTTRLVNNGLVTESRLGRMFAVHVGPTYRDARSVFRSQLMEWDPIIDKVTDLLVRMNTEQAEIAATVHFVARNVTNQKGRRPREDEVLAEVMNWKQKRRPPLNEFQVAHSIRSLNLLSWLDAQASPDLPLPEDELRGI